MKSGEAASDDALRRLRQRRATAARSAPETAEAFAKPRIASGVRTRRGGWQTGACGRAAVQRVAVDAGLRQAACGVEKGPVA